MGVVRHVYWGGKRGGGLELCTDIQLPFQPWPRWLVKPVVWTPIWLTESKRRPRTPPLLQQPEARRSGAGEQSTPGHGSEATNPFDSMSLPTTTLQSRMPGSGNCSLPVLSAFQLGRGKYSIVKHPIALKLLFLCITHWSVRPLQQKWYGSQHFFL